jgi:hypothetical protein
MASRHLNTYCTSSEPVLTLATLELIRRLAGAAVLFWIDRELDLWGWGEAVLHQADFDFVDGSWLRRGGGGAGTYTAEEILATKGCWSASTRRRFSRSGATHPRARQARGLFDRATQRPGCLDAASRGRSVLPARDSLGSDRCS